ncbi:MAG: RDD family protein [Planctomycetota bacterium]|nr:RDD family protein [Planctomycetota bacterium]
MAQDTVDPIDGTISIVTPENITFHYHVAGPFQRAMAYLIDIGIRTLILIIMIIIAVMVVLQIGEIGVGVFLVTQFLLSWFYGAIFETYMNGQTPGKRLLGLRAVTVDGKPINAMQAVMRNLMRTADTYPLVAPAAFGITWGDSAIMHTSLLPTFIIGLAVMSLNKRYQRIGDLIAGTMVILDHKKQTQGLHDVRQPAVLYVASLLPLNYRPDQSMSQALAHFIDQRNRLSQERRDEIAGRLSKPLCRQFKLDSNINPDLLLQALYYRAFISDGQEEVAQAAPMATIAGYQAVSYPPQVPQPVFGQPPVLMPPAAVPPAIQPATPAVHPNRPPPSRPPKRGEF